MRELRKYHRTALIILTVLMTLILVTCGTGENEDTPRQEPELRNGTPAGVQTQAPADLDVNGGIWIWDGKSYPRRRGRNGWGLAHNERK